MKGKTGIMQIAGIDPGPKLTGLVIAEWVGSCRDVEKILYKGKVPNVDVIPICQGCDCAVVEMVACYGMPVGKEVFETVKWIGRFECMLDRELKIWHTELYRMQVKMQMCRSPKANDGTIRQALIDRYGGKEKAIGLKKTPGILYGLSGDCWSALALIQTYIETRGFLPSAAA